MLDTHLVKSSNNTKLWRRHPTHGSFGMQHNMHTCPHIAVGQLSRSCIRSRSRIQEPGASDRAWGLQTPFRTDHVTYAYGRSMTSELCPGKARLPTKYWLVDVLSHIWIEYPAWLRTRVTPGIRIHGTSFYYPYSMNIDHCPKVMNHFDPSRIHGSEKITSGHFHMRFYTRKNLLDVRFSISLINL